MESKYRIAIVGSGPSGFFTADNLLRLCQDCEIDMFEKYPDPFGLVRRGVAPDNPKIRSVTKAFDDIAKNDRFAYFGNVEVGVDISLVELMDYYHAVVLASGMETSQRLCIPGEDLPGSYTASSIVGWYNCHPVYSSLNVYFSGERAVIIGMGNVALDVARILLKHWSDLQSTDISSKALKDLELSKINTVYIVGRRGPTQVKFRENELLALEEIPDLDIVVSQEDLELNIASQSEMENSISIQRIYKWFLQFAQREIKHQKKLHFLFYRYPIRIIGNGGVEGIVFEKTQLVGEPFQQKAVGTGVVEKLDCDYVIASIGYRGNIIPGVPYDERSGTIPNIQGRVYDGQEIRKGLYVVGWAKRGPVGLIGHNKPDSAETAKCVLEDLPSLGTKEIRSREDLIRLLENKGIRYVTFEEWKKVDEMEIQLGTHVGKVRERFRSKFEILKFLEKM